MRERGGGEVGLREGREGREGEIGDGKVRDKHTEICQDHLEAFSRHRQQCPYFCLRRDIIYRAFDREEMKVCVVPKPRQGHLRERN